MRSCQLTDTYRGLLAAVCADPADDTPRLVMADYLDEEGWPERAKFIRVSIESFHQNQRGKWGIEEEQLLWSRGCEFATEVAAIFGRHRPYEDFDKSGCKNWQGIWWRWSRGFISELHLPGESFFNLADQIARTVPLQTIKIIECWPEWSVQEQAYFLRSPSPRRSRLNPQIVWPRGGEVPEPIWSRLEGGRPYRSVRFYKGQSSQWQHDVSQACLGYAREKAFPEVPAHV